MTDSSRFTADKMSPREGEERRIVIRFNADASKQLPWKFEPQQKEVWVKPGETALAFYKAWNKGDKDIIGVATYNVQPEKVCLFLTRNMFMD
jgi:cytochrome c oxidase assembly protein subunit 11